MIDGFELTDGQAGAVSGHDCVLFQRPNMLDNWCMKGVAVRELHQRWLAHFKEQNGAVQLSDFDIGRLGMLRDFVNVYDVSESIATVLHASAAAIAHCGFARISEPTSLDVVVPASNVAHVREALAQTRETLRPVYSAKTQGYLGKSFYRYEVVQLPISLANGRTLIVSPMSIMAGFNQQSWLDSAA